MPKKKRDLPPQNIHRFNYWEFFHPGGLNVIAPIKQHIQEQFTLLLNASPAVWNKEVLPWLHKDVSVIRHRPLYALKFYVENDKEWEQDPQAHQVLKRLSPRQKAAVLRHFRTTWPERSKRPARLTRTWKKLFRDIAHDQDRFERFCENPPEPDTLSGTDARIYKSYSPQAMKLLGAIFIDKTRRGSYRAPNLLDESDEPELSSLLSPTGWIRCKSIFEANWLDLSRKDRREAKRRTIHWFHHALRNMREYRNRRAQIPLTPECEKTCRQIHKKILNS